MKNRNRTLHHLPTPRDNAGDSINSAFARVKNSQEYAAVSRDAGKEARFVAPSRARSGLASVLRDQREGPRATRGVFGH
jgi:hypothetical protein